MKSIQNTTKDEIPKQLNDLFYSALNSSIDSVLIADAKGKIVWVNVSFEQLTGYSYQEAVGKDTSLLKSGQQTEQFYKNMWNTLLSAHVWQGELWNKRKDGTLYLEDQTITPVLDDKDNTTHFVAIKRDVSQKVAIKRQLEHLEKMDAIGQVIGGISHNFNNKLANVIGYTELANEVSIKYNDEKLSNYLEKIAAAGAEAKKLVQQLQIYCHEDNANFKPLTLIEYIEEIIALIRSAIPNNINLNVSSKGELEQIEAEPSQLYQMLMILVQNAVHASPVGGDISINVEQVNLSDKTCCGCLHSVNGNFMQLTFKDTGDGIESKNMNKLFLPFYTSHQMDGGTGMGLSLLHGMLHEHNGHVLVDSKLDQGTTFTLLFPILEEDNLTPHCIDEAESKSAHLAHLLLVDDERAVVELTTELLEFMGFKVTAEIDVQSALSALMSNPYQFDLLITDQSMPGITGLMLIKAIKNIRADLPAILISGKPEDTFKKDVNFDDLVDGFLMKPFRTKELNELIEKLLFNKSTKLKLK